MPTLYITQQGFRFPYQKWTDVTTIQNLQFLEAQLDEYLHSHENDGTTLWVTPQGFRVPDKKIRDNLENNMKFIEAQLEKYLHSHEGGVLGGELLTDPSVDLQNATVKTMDATLDSGDHYVYSWAAHSPGIGDINTDVTAPTSSPHESTQHIRAVKGAGSEIPGPSVQVTIMVVNPALGVIYDPIFDSYQPLTAEVTPGRILTASFWIRSNNATSQNVLFRLTFLDESLEQTGSGLDEDVADDFDGAYTQYTLSNVEVPADAKYVEFSVRASNSTNVDPPPVLSLDFDTFSLIQSGVPLVTTQAGFRFPYDWTSEGHIRHNIKFLETEISKYLHRHESGA